MKLGKSNISINQWVVLILTIGFVSVANHGNAAYLICLKANGDVAVETTGTKGHCASHRGLQPENHQEPAQPCVGMLLFLNAGDALNSGSTYKVSPYLSHMTGRVQSFPEIDKSFQVVSDGLNKTRPVNLALLALQKTVLLN